jgi:hypothetical protein
MSVRVVCVSVCVCVCGAEDQMKPCFHLKINCFLVSLLPGIICRNSEPVKI